MKKPFKQFKDKRIYISGTDSVDSVMTINWLLDRGARVTVVGAHKDSEIGKRIDEHLKRTASDGEAYEKVRAQLSWTSNDSTPLTDVRALFLSVWKKKVIGITGKHGKTTTAVWAAHLIGDAVVAGHMPERPLLPALDSRARVAIIKFSDAVPASFKMAVVSTDAMSNLDAAIQVAHLAGTSKTQIQRRMSTLPQMSLRQEVVYQSAKLTVINDALATEPARGISALRRWGGPTCVLICGGTDRKFDYREWARELPKHVRPTNTIFLTGSATKKMRVALGSDGRGIRAYDTLAAAFKAARVRSGLYVSSVVLFSPAAHSIELFADEYDRGQQFNTLVKRELGKK